MLRLLFYQMFGIKRCALRQLSCNLSTSSFLNIGYHEDFESDKDREQNPPVFKSSYFGVIKRLKEQPYLLSPLKLLYIPIDSLKFRKEKNFVEELAVIWWRSMESKLNEVYMADLKKMLRALNDINRLSEGDLIDRLGCKPIVCILTCMNDRHLEIAPRNLSYSISALVSMASCCNDNSDKRLITDKASELFPKYISACYEGRAKYASTLHNDIASITCDFITLGCEKPSEEICIKQLVWFFRQTITCPKNENNAMSYSYFFSLDRIAKVLLYWNVNANFYERSFWSEWYQQSGRCFRQMEKNYDTYNALYLYHCLMICLKFDQEQEFLQMKDVFADVLPHCKQHLRKDQLPVEELKRKYISSPLSDFIIKLLE